LFPNVGLICCIATTYCCNAEQLAELLNALC
jgi:hypothetical protein